MAEARRSRRFNTRALGEFRICADLEARLGLKRHGRRAPALWRCPDALGPSRRLITFFFHESVCHKLTRSRQGVGPLLCGEDTTSTGLTAPTTVLGFMGEGSPRCWSTIRDNCLEEAQPPETNHESARWLELGSKRCRGPVRFGRLSAGSGTLGADYGSSAATGIGARDATEGFGFWLFIHAGLKHELTRRFLAALRNPVGLTTHSRCRPQVFCSVMGRELELMERNLGDFWNYLPPCSSHPRKCESDSF
jgi:hypothetical protein